MKIIYSREMMTNREQGNPFPTSKHTMMEYVDEKRRAKYIHLYVRIVKMGLHYLGTWPMTGESSTDKTWRYIRLTFNLFINIVWTVQLLIHISLRHKDLDFAETFGPLVICATEL